MKNRRGISQWWSVGGLCKHDQLYNRDDDWVHGFGYLEQVEDSDTFTFHNLSVIGGKFVFNNTLYCSDGSFKSA